MMKNILYLVFLFFALTSCQKEDPLTENKDATSNFSGGTITNPGGGGNGGGGQNQHLFEADVDGNPFSVTSVSLVNSLGGLMITATSPSSKAMTISFHENITPGVYDFSSNTPSASYLIAGGNPLLYEGSGPALEIISNDTASKVIRGNFYFTGYTSPTDSVNITNGYLEVHY